MIASNSSLEKQRIEGRLAPAFFADKSRPQTPQAKLATS